MTYYDVCRWTDLHDLIVNRVNVINQMLGARYDNSADNALRVILCKGIYSLYICGALFATWHVYDLDETCNALERINAVNDAVWFFNKSGRLLIT